MISMCCLRIGVQLQYVIDEADYNLFSCYEFGRISVDGLGQAQGAQRPVTRAGGTVLSGIIAGRKFRLLAGHAKVSP